MNFKNAVNSSHFEHLGSSIFLKILKIEPLLPRWFKKSLKIFEFERSLQDAYNQKIFQKSIHKEIIKLDKLLFKLHFSFFKWQVS